MTRNDVENVIRRLKGYIVRESERENYENVLSLVSLTAGVLYGTNIYYADYELENYIASVAEKLRLTENLHGNFHDDTVMFYDGFGLNSRGLIQIYLKALCKVRKVVYVTSYSRRNEIPDVLKILSEHDSKVCFLDGRTRIRRIKQLNEFIQNEKPGHFFFYSWPGDVYATVIMNAYEGIMKRYQINLTDHAFWLGAKPIDFCIEFRNYGAGISYEYRKIPKEKLIKIPYYPVINYDAEFQGYPFDVKDSQKVIFSGGALYKTLGGGNKYYEIVDYILGKYPEALFWYAGTGDRSEISKIIRKYPGRACVTAERSDLYQVLKHCYFYLSTYPVAGGLMFQYAARAGKVPLTLCYDRITTELLFNQENLGIMFGSLEALFTETDRLMNDKDYCRTKGKSLESSVISENDFDSEVAKLFTGHAGEKYAISYSDHVETESFRQVYLDNLTPEKLKLMLVSRYNRILLKYEPVLFITGALKKAFRKILNRLRKNN